MEISDAEIHAIDRPHPRLLTLYILRSLLTGPLVLVTLPVLFFRYETMHYQFDDEGIHMRWGFFFRRQINLTYARIQDIHLTSGLLQRWLGLADINVQTASGSASAEMTIEGLMEYEGIRNYLYAKMRGYREGRRAAPAADGPAPAVADPAVALLTDLVQEMRATRTALERLTPPEAAGRPGVDADV